MGELYLSLFHTFFWLTHKSISIKILFLICIEAASLDVAEYNDKLRRMIARLVELEGKSEHAEKLKMLKQLVTMSEEMKSQEAYVFLKMMTMRMIE